MYKLPCTIIVLALATLTLTAFASPLHAQAPRGVGGTAYSCGPDTGDRVEGSQICTCSGFADCAAMANSGICGGPGNDTTVDTACNKQTGDCQCSEGGIPTGSVTQGHGFHPKAAAPATRNAPNNDNTRDHRGKTRAAGPDQRSHRVSASNQTKPARHPTGRMAQPPVAPGTSTLTSAECRTLGGDVRPMAVCRKSGLAGIAGGSACFTTDARGKTHAVCIGASSSARTINPSPRPTSPAGRREARVAENAVVAPLTSQECKGLGGVVTATNKCRAKGQETCSTADKHGVVRVACIDKVVDD